MNATQVTVSLNRTNPVSGDDDSLASTRVAVAGTSLGGRVVQQRDPVVFPAEAARLASDGSSSSSTSGILALPMMALLVSGVAVSVLYTRRGHELASSFGMVTSQGEWTKMPLKDVESGSFQLFAMGLPLVNQAVGALGGWIPTMRQGDTGMEMKQPLYGDGYAYSDAGSDCDLPEAELKVNLNDLDNDLETPQEAEVPKQCEDLMNFDPSEKATSPETKNSSEQATSHDHNAWGFPPMQKMSLDDMGLFDSSAAALNKDSGMDDFFDDEDDF